MNPNTIQKMLNNGASVRKSDRLSKKEYNKTVFVENYAAKVEMFKTIGKEKQINYKKLMNPEKSKQEKKRRDTWRRTEMPCEEEENLNNMYYANFLGDKYGDNGTPYNNKLAINVKFCDSMSDSLNPLRITVEKFVYNKPTRAAKRLRDEDDSEVPKNKRARTDDESNNV